MYKFDICTILCSDLYYFTIGYMGEQDKSSRWIATFGLYIKREATNSSTSLQSRSHECSRKIFFTDDKICRILF